MLSLRGYMPRPKLVGVCQHSAGSRLVARSIALGFAALLLFFSDEASAQSLVCAKVSPVSGEYGYNRRSNDARCEGVYSTPVAGQRLELRSLTAGALKYDLRTDATLYVTAPDIAGLGSGNGAILHVQAKALPLRKHYLMDALLTSSGTLSWPIGDVLKPQGLSVDMIGVAGWVEQPARMVYVPIGVSPNKSPYRKQPVFLIFTSDAMLEEFSWRTWLDDQGTAPQAYQSMPPESLPSQAGFPIYLQVQAGSGTTELEVVVRASGANAKQTRRFAIFSP